MVAVGVVDSALLYIYYYSCLSGMLLSFFIPRNVYRTKMAMDRIIRFQAFLFNQELIFRTFFGATLIGKAIVKMHIQKVINCVPRSVVTLKYIHSI